MIMVNDPYHYPPDLVSLLIDTIPVLHRSKQDVLGFFRGRGIADALLADLQHRVDADRDSISKYEIARTVIERVNQLGDTGLRVRREIVKRVVEWEDFSTCWPDKSGQAEGLVAKVRQMVNVKDSFTRMQQERDREREDRLRPQREAAEAAQRRREERQTLYRELVSLFGMANPQQRGTRFEALLNKIFQLDGLGVRESFTLVIDSGQVGEQIDGLIELGNQPYMVEAKWWNKPLGVDGVSQHLVRVYGRAGVHGLIISANGFADTAIEQCKTALSQRTVVLAELREVVFILEREGDLAKWLKAKTYAAGVDRKPLHLPDFENVV
ncbi:restriction endonuclease [Amycolatopsis sp. NPDC059657]|uniref:restriction endonuclease n=1 Tax=Amycolatopsis sp. NPDC059657 TaxID=3346899 RepID=UPI003672CC98